MKKVSDIASKLVPPWEPCAQCRDSAGWVRDGLTRSNNVQFRRCPCVIAYRERIQQAVAQADKRERK